MPTAFAFNNEQAMARRQRVLMEAQGIYAETLPRNAFSSIAAGVSGTIYFQAVGLLAGDVVTNMSVDCGTVGNTMTLVKLGLYDKNGNRLATSAESSASFAATGTKTLAMALTANGTPPVITSDDVYFAAWIGVATTVPAIRRGPGGLAATGGIGSGTGCAAIQTGQTDLGTSQTLTFNNSNVLPMWIGIS